MDLSLFVLEAGIRLFAQAKPDLMYPVPHRLHPAQARARRPGGQQFYRRIDEPFGRLAELGAIVALTADHGMNDKSATAAQRHLPSGHLGCILRRRRTRVICPITDAFVAHHGALGGFVRVWCRDGGRRRRGDRRLASAFPAIAAALDRERSAAAIELPPTAKATWR